MKVTASIPVFIEGVSFPRKKPGNCERAWVALEDDADCHKFQVAFETADVRALMRALEENEENEESDGIAKGTLVLVYPRVEDDKPTTCDGCIIAGTGKAVRCKTHGCSICGWVMLADTEDWKHPLCEQCFEELKARFREVR